MRDKRKERKKSGSKNLRTSNETNLTISAEGRVHSVALISEKKLVPCVILAFNGEDIALLIGIFTSRLIIIFSEY